MFYLFLIIIIVITVVLTTALLGNKTPPVNDPNAYTTFLGSNYSILIEGELTRDHVQQAEAVIGTIRGVQIGTLVTSIGSNEDMAPFYNQTSLTSLTFKGTSTCTSIGDSCFYGCTGLTSVAFPSSLSIFGKSAFGNTTLTSVTFDGSGETRTVTTNSIITGENPFSSPSDLVSAAAGNNLTIPAGGIEYSVSDTYTTFVGTEGTYSVLIEGVLQKSDVEAAEAAVDTITEVQIGTSVTSIGVFSDVTKAPFNGNTDLTSLTFKTGSTCTDIEIGSFEGCTGLTSLTFPDSLLKITSGFPGCTGLTSVTFGDSLTTIQGTAFQYCNGLSTLVFPSSLVAVTTFAFNQVNNLESVTFENDTPDEKTVTTQRTIIGYNPFSSPASLVSTVNSGVNTIEIPAGGIEYVSNTYTTFVGTGGTYSVLIEGVLQKSDVDAVEAEIDTITEVQIGTSVTTIGVFSDVTKAPFDGNTDLTSLTFKTGSTCTDIEFESFKGCTGLTSLTFPDSLLVIRSSFSGCTSLTSVTFGDSITAIIDTAFQNCNGLSTLVFPTTVTDLTGVSFSGVNNLTSVTFENNTLDDKTVYTHLTVTSFNPFSSPQSLVSAVIMGGDTLEIPWGGFEYT